MIVPGNGGVTTPCPNTIGYDPGVIFGDTSAGGADNSPFGWDPSSAEGSVHCQDSGRMVYWENPSSGTEYNFRVNTQAGRSGEVCMRMWISVRFDGDTRLFPRAHPYADPTNPTPYESDQDAVASHLAKNSERFCVKIENNWPSGSFSIDNVCNNRTFQISGVSDADHLGSDLIYQIRGVSGSSTWPINFTPSGSGSAVTVAQTSGGSAGGSASFTAEQGYRLYVWDPDMADWHHAASAVTPGNTCQDYPPTGFIENHNCNVISVGGVSDRNDPKGPIGGLRVTIRAWPQDGPRSIADGRAITLFDGRVNNRVDVGVPEDLSNIGWEYDIYIYNIGLNAAGNPTDSPAFHPWNIYQRSGATGPCYQAACSIDILEAPGLPEGGVIGGENFTFNLTITNTGWPRASILPDGVGGNQLTGSDGGGDFDFAPLDFFSSGAEYVPRADQGGNSVTRTFSMAAPDDINSRTLSIYPDYYGRFAIGWPPCNATVHTYQHFRLEPRVNSVTANDYEDPTEINYKTIVDQRTEVQPWASTPQYSVPANSTRSLIWKRGGVTQGTLQGPTNNNGLPRFNDVTYDDTYENTSIPRDFRAGDQFCAVISVYPATGQIGPGDDIRNPAGLSSDDTGPNCGRVVDRPYVRYYGSDVFAGGQFGSPGAGTNGDIKTYIKRATNVPEGSTYGAGSGVEFAAFALGLIQVTSDQSTGFTSASLRSTAPSPPSGLSFASTALGMGGNYATTRSVTDYFNETKKIDTPKTDNVNSLNLSTLADNQQSWVSPLGINKTNLTNGGGYNVRHAVYVEGDVLISGNIVYAGSGAGGWATLDSIPNFSLVVRGNIYIANNVTQLDGLYVAQPTSGTTGGRIYTCTRPDGSLFAPGEVFDNCRTKLKVNGSFIAQDTRLLRTYGTLSDVGVAQLPQAAVDANPGHDMVWTFGPATRPNGPSGSQTLAQAQANTGKNNCVEINEPWAPIWNNYRDNWLCYDEPLGLVWNWGGSALPAGYNCVSFNNPNAPAAEAWADDRLCWPPSTGDANFLTMVWDSAPPTDKQCTGIEEYGDAQAWGANKAWLCYPDTENPGTGLRPLTYVRERFNGPDEDHAAESFRLPPDLYLSNPVFKAEGSRSNGKYDQVLSLPPVL